jgi:hypothetical protein
MSRSETPRDHDLADISPRRILTSTLEARFFGVHPPEKVLVGAEKKTTEKKFARVVDVRNYFEEVAMKRKDDDALHKLKFRRN